jgi:uncharacterized repeat protein (TIGR02543 family)
MVFLFAMNKLKTIIPFLMLVSVSLTLPKSWLSASASSTVLRYAQDDLGAAAVATSDFNFNGTNVSVTKNTSKGLVMTTGGSQASSIFLKEQMAANPTRPGFSTYFVMNVYRLNPGPADGYMFVIAANSNSLGEQGGGLGYTGITNSVGIEFDFYDNGGENMASSDVFVNGVSRSTPGTVFDSGYLTRWNQVSSGQLVRAFHTWIEYDHANTRLELRVALSNNESPSASRPARPTNPLLTRTSNFSQISNFFYAGFTAATGGQMQQMSLKSWFFSNAYIAGGINPDATNIVIDSTPPTAPTITTTNVNGQYQLSISGGTDDTGIAGYQYKAPGGNWTGYTSPVTMLTDGEWQARTIDQAGNYSLTVASTTLYRILYSAGGVIRKTSYRVNTDPSYNVDFSYFDGVNMYTDWYLASSFSGDPLTTIAPRTTTLTIFGKPIQNVFTVNYVLDGGTLASANPDYYFLNEGLELNDPTKEGYTFQGWYLDAGFTQPFDETNIPQQNFVLYAAFEINLYSITIYLNDDALTVDTQLYAYNTSFSALLAPFESATKVGHTFAGWYTDEARTQPLLANATVSTHTSIYADWTINSYDVTFRLADGTFLDSVPFDYQSPITFIESPVIYGFTFSGWTSEGELFAESTLMPAFNLTLIATFTRNAYGLTFNLNNGTMLPGLLLPYETLIADHLPTQLDKEGHTFVGWYYDASFTVPVAPEDTLQALTTLHAQWSVNNYLTTFDVDGGSSIQSYEQTFGSSFTLPENPVKEGHTFVGWYTDDTLLEPFTLETVPATHTTLFARWSVNSYVITINSDGGTPLEPIDLPFGSSIVQPTIPSRVGYSFIGWFTIENESNPIPYSFPETMPAQSVEVVALWRINTYRIQFESNGGSPVLDIIEDYQTPLLSPSRPERTGYTFTGWYTDEGLNDVYTFTSMPAMDLTLYAGWSINQYTVSFLTNEGSSVSAITLDYLAPLASPEPPTRTGYTFAGWYEDVELTTSFTWSTMPAFDVTLYAAWSINSYTYSFETNGGTSVLPITQAYASSIDAPLSPTRTGYTFTGWYVDETLTNAYTFTTVPANDVTLYAGWSINQYALSFSETGDSNLDTIIYDYDQPLDILPTPEKLGHTFDGWYVDEARTQAVELTSMPAHDVTLYAKWSINSYTLTIVSAHVESPLLVQDVVYNQKPSMPTQPTWDGYTFLGWSHDGVMMHADWIMPAFDVTLHASWFALSSQVILITPNETTIITTTSGQAIGSLPTVAIKPGYIFLGWSLVQGDASQIIDGTYIVPNGQTIRLYPIWEKTNDASILFSQWMHVGSSTLESYTYEIIVFSMTMLVGISLFIGYRKRVAHAS